MEQRDRKRRGKQKKMAHKNHLQRKKNKSKRDHAAKSWIDAELHTGLQAQVQSAEGPCHFIFVITFFTDPPPLPLSFYSTSRVVLYSKCSEDFGLTVVSVECQNM